MVKMRKILPLILAFVLAFCLIAPVGAYADGVWLVTEVEQIRVNVPNVNMYFYPLDINGDLVQGLSGANTEVQATLGNEKLKTLSLTNAKDEGTLYIVAVNTSAPDTGFGYLQSVMNSLKYWLDGMSEKDKMMLISYTDSPTVLLDGTENRTAAETGIDSLATDTAKTDAVLAVKKAIELSQNAGEGFPERHVLVMFDDGKFVAEENPVNLENLLASLKAANLPMYALGHEKMYYEEFSDFAVDAEGAGIQTNGYSCEDEAKIIKSYIDSGYVVKFAAPTNKLTPRERHLDVTFENSGVEYQVSYSVVVDKHIPDTVAPVIEKAEFGEENDLKIWFSEDVLGADKVSSYVLKNSSDKELVIEKAEYNRGDHTVVLKLKTAPSSGKHTLQLPGVTDNSEEKNPVAFSGNDQWYTIDSGSSKLILWIAVAAAVVLAAGVMVAVVLSKKKKEEEEAERQRRAEEEKRIEEQNKAQFNMLNQRINQVQQRQGPVVDANTKGIAANLNVSLPNGMKKKHQIVVNSRYVVGRKADRCDYAIADEKISSRHFSLSVSFDKLMISDLNSTNGTYVNGIKIDRPRMLQSGDTIVAGGTKIIISF